MEWNAIYAETFALDDKGRRYIADGAGDEIAKHQIAIQITD